MEERDLKTAALTEINSGIVAVARESVAHDEAWDFFCECGRPDCDARVPLTIAAYVALRDGDGDVLAPGHHRSRAERARTGVTRPTPRRASDSPQTVDVSATS